MKISIGKDSFSAEANLSNIEETVIKTIPEKIFQYFNDKKNIKIIKSSIIQLRNECFNKLSKKFKYKKYSLPIPRTIEQFKQDLECLKFIEDDISENYLDKRLETDTIEYTMLKRFYDENGGMDNFISFFQKGIKINKYILQPFKNVYTYTKKIRAVFIIEEFKKSDNSYCLSGYCTKNFEPKRL